jgi:hypothetical protein
MEDGGKTGEHELEGRSLRVGGKRGHTFHGIGVTGDGNEIAKRVL